MYKLRFHSVTTSVDLPKLPGADMSLLSEDYEEDKKQEQSEGTSFRNLGATKNVPAAKDEYLMQISQLSPRSLKRIGSKRNMGNSNLVRRPGKRHDLKIEKDPSRHSFRLWADSQQDSPDILCESTGLNEASGDKILVSGEQGLPAESKKVTQPTKKDSYKQGLVTPARAT